METSKIKTKAEKVLGYYVGNDDRIIDGLHEIINMLNEKPCETDKQAQVIELLESSMRAMKTDDFLDAYEFNKQAIALLSDDKPVQEPDHIPDAGEKVKKSFKKAKEQARSIQDNIDAEYKKITDDEGKVETSEFVTSLKFELAYRSTVGKNNLFDKAVLEACNRLKSETKERKRYGAMYAAESVLRNEEIERADAAEASCKSHAKYIQHLPECELHKYKAVVLINKKKPICTCGLEALKG